MSDTNTATFTGRLAQQPDVRRTPSGVAVTDFVLANNVYYGKKERTLFIRCACWNKTAEFAATLNTGDHVSVTGTLVDDNYTPKGADQPTKGRVRLEAQNVNIMHRKTVPTKTTTPSDQPTNI